MHLGSLLVACVLAVAGPVATGSVLSAAAEPEHRLAISTDGVHFSTASPVALFPDGVVLVPGSAAHAELWLRNDAESTANLTLELVGDGGAETRSVMQVAAVVGATVGDELPITFGAQKLVPTAEVFSGAVVPVTVSVSLADSSGNVDQLELESFSLKITLGSDVAVIDDSVVAPPPPSVPPGIPEAELSNGASENVAAPRSDATAQLSWTGFAADHWLLLGGLLAVGGAGLLIAVRRRRDPDQVERQSLTV